MMEKWLKKSLYNGTDWQSRSARVEGYSYPRKQASEKIPHGYRG
jgi:hypothetical protein